MNEQQRQTDAPVSWHWSLKLFISLLLMYHLFAVFIAPFTFATTNPSSVASPAARFGMEKMRPYVDIMYLNHGYFFFAPEPGPSHLMRFAAADSKERLVFPHRKQQWPRLLYHRHFMLSEWLNTMAPAQEDTLRRQRPDDPRLKLYDRLREAYTRHVEYEFDLSDVKLTRMQHGIPGPAEYFRERMKLTDAQLYRDLEPETVSLPPRRE